jgi:hypothetical protein
MCDITSEPKLVGLMWTRPDWRLDMRTLRILVVLLVGMLAACARDFERYNAGTAQLWIGGRVQVEQECRRRGTATLTMDSHILGCTDFAAATMISISDPRVIAHEYCHWTRQTASHELCPVPKDPQ